ncbi:hypothetical protein KI688_004904 [Linnemannia hyalina]|uniref:CHCH domain-containing protein n=1 Tax=Linnemannia hyalina TaxID=64524 RepID=A0A9P7XL72_9FUNG|nr:hypothetical protein KI688_004904 [Linnemannia hyalina]
MRLKYLRTKPRKVVEASPCIVEMGAMIQCWTASGVDDAKCMQTAKMLADCMKNLQLGPGSDKFAASPKEGFIQEKDRNRIQSILMSSAMDLKDKIGPTKVKNVNTVNYHLARLQKQL